MSQMGQGLRLPPQPSQDKEYIGQSQLGDAGSQRRLKEFHFARGRVKRDIGSLRQGGIDRVGDADGPRPAQLAQAKTLDRLTGISSNRNAQRDFTPADLGGGGQLHVGVKLDKGGKADEAQPSIQRISDGIRQPHRKQGNPLGAAKKFGGVIQSLHRVQPKCLAQTVDVLLKYSLNY